MKTAIFGGSFNPPHMGHISIAKCVLSQLEPDRLVLVPTGETYYKKNAVVTAENRFEMCRIIAEKYGFEVNDIEISKGGYSYTAETLEYFQAAYPDDELFFILGGDSLDYIDKWKNPEKIFSLCTLIVAKRDGYNDKAEYLRQKFGAKIKELDFAPYDVSSSDIRRRLQCGNHDFSDLDSEVAQYIMENNLYTYDTEYLKQQIKPLLKPERYEHSLGVMELAEQLAMHYGENPLKAKVAALLHDCAKNLEFDTMHEYMMRAGKIDDIVLSSKGLWHGPASAQYAKEHFDIDDEIFEAVFYHTIGKPNMNLLCKIIFLADVLEVGRDVEFEWSMPLRKQVFEDMDKTLLDVLDITIISLIERKMVMHPNPVEIRNSLLLQKKEKI